ncbi:recombination protein NinG [Comamonas sp. C24C]
MLMRKNCPQCKRKLTEGDRIHKECITPYADSRAEKARRKAKKLAQSAARIIRQEDAKRKEALKTRSDWMKEAQQAFNEFIRERDRQAGHPCISSGRALDWSGNQVDAGHYRSTGAASHLRFNEDNCHAQSKHDNQYLAGNAVDYRIGLIARIGLARVQALECDNEPRKFSIDELLEIRNTYRAKTRQLKKDRA